jgi:hypothetical protein
MKCVNADYNTGRLNTCVASHLGPSPVPPVSPVPVAEIVGIIAGVIVILLLLFIFAGN